jgi:C4-dicarboxylate-specific signal transduction histidine kinase
MHFNDMAVVPEILQSLSTAHSFEQGQVREVIELTHGEVVKNGISVQMQLADGLPLIEGDRVQLQQVVLNLIVNAVQAMGAVADGTGELLITTVQASTRCSLRSRMQGPVWPLTISSAPWILSTRPSWAVWGWDCRSAARSSRLMKVACG